MTSHCTCGSMPVFVEELVVQYLQFLTFFEYMDSHVSTSPLYF